MIKKLTQSFVQSLKPEGTPYCVTDTECAGLYVYVGKSKKTYYLKYIDNVKRQRKHKIGEAGDVLTVAQARALATQLKAKLITGESIVPKKASPTLRLGEFINDIYAPWREAAYKRGDATVNTIRSCFEKTFFQEAITDITIQKIDAWRLMRQKEVKNTTINKNIIALGAALDWGVEHGYFSANPLEKIKSLDERDSKTIVRYLTDDERSRLMLALDERENKMRKKLSKNCDNVEEGGNVFADHLKPMVIVALNTGIRRGNLFTLKWRDIDFNSRTLALEGDVTKNGRIHRVPLNRATREALASWCKQSERTGEDDLVFPSEKDPSKSFTDLKKAWATLLKNAGIEKFRWHDMRHDFASKLVMRGVALNTVRELLGHADLKMTLRYAHLAPGVTMEAVEILDDDLT